MKKSYINIVIDILLLLLLTAITGVGILLRYTKRPEFIPGDIIDVYPSNMMGMNRQEWGYIHWILSLAFMFFIIVHIILHWQMITSILSRMIPNKIVRNSVFFMIMTVAFLFIVIPLGFVIFQ